MPHRLHHLDPSELVRFGDLELLARTVVEGHRRGAHRSANSGSSIEFAHYRPYSQGDDPRYVDWKLYGRTDRLFLKQSQQDSNLRCMLLFDCSASMDYGSGAVTKFQYARMMIASLAMLLTKQGDATGLLTYATEVMDHVPVKSARHHLNRILTTLHAVEPSAGGTETGKTLALLGEVLPARGMVILISDLLHPVEEMIDHLKSLRARRHDVLILHVSDPAEREFPFDRSQTFVDAENEAEQFAVPSMVRQAYLENRAAHFDEIKRECLAAEIDVEDFCVTEPLDRTLQVFVRRRGRGLLRGSTARAGSARAGSSGAGR